MATTKLDAEGVIKRCFNEAEEALDVSTVGNLVAKPWDKLKITYPDTITEVYTFKLADNTVVATITVTFTDASKDNTDEVIRVYA